MIQTKVRKIGNSLGVLLPQEVTSDMRIAEGDVVTLVRTKDGYAISPFDPKVAEALDVFERGRKKYRNALRELAK
jgi:putative addiction module antidote